MPFFAVRKKFLFYKPKAIFCTNLSLFPPKAILFHPPPPIRATLNLLSAKNAAFLLLFALILCCKAGVSHRFKSLPAIPGKLAVFCVAGYLMNAGCFSKNTLSTGDLNRPRSPEVRKPLACFLVLFARRKKNVKTSFCRKLRGSANLESAHRSRSFAPQQLKPFSGSFEVLQTSKQRTQTTNLCIPIKSFRRPQRHPFCGLRRTKTCHRQLFARPSMHFFCC